MTTDMTGTTGNRRALTRTERYAALIVNTLGVDREWAKDQTPAEIVAAFEARIAHDHRIPLALGGTNHPTNIDHLARRFHTSVKTPDDLSAIAKAKRIAKAQAEFRTAVLAKNEPVARPATPRRRRPFPGSKASGWKHRMDGVWQRRERK